MTKQLLLTLALGLCSLSAVADNDVTAEKAAQNTPEGWTAVQLPNIPSTCKTVTVTGLSETGTAADNAAAIQTALNNVDATNGTMVVIPSGTYLCNPISIRKDKTILHLSAGTTLKLPPYEATATETAYPKNSSGGYDNFINNINANSSAATRYDIIIEGEGKTSVIEGQGGPWWDAVEQKTISVSRPAIIRLTKGSRFLFRNFKTQNTPGVNVCLGMSGGASNMTVHDVTISNPSSVCSDPSHNTDGIPIWGAYVNIYDCNISTGDDNIVADSNTQYCHAWNITCGAGHGMSIGSYTEKLNHIIYEKITFNNTETGFRIKTSTGRSGNSYSGTSSNGAVSDIICRNSTMTGVLQPIVLTELYDDDKEDPSTIASSTVTYQTPEFCNILFQDIKSTGTAYNAHFKYGCPIYIYGRPESYIHDITFDNVQVEAQKGMFLAYCKDIHFKNGSYISPASTIMKYNAEYDGDITGGYVTLDNSSVVSKGTGGISPWTFNDGYTITYDNTSKAYGNSDSYIKFSTGFDYTINIPSGKYVQSITFNGYDNYTTGTSYIYKVNGTEYDATTYEFPIGQDKKSYTIDFANTVSGTLPFQLRGKQACLSIKLKTTDTPSAINEVSANAVKSNTGVIKTANYIIKNGKKYNYAGQQVR